MALRVVATLSGGERLRAALACLFSSGRPPQLLRLDEPTNHLDLESTQLLEACLSRYDGALLVTSHDTGFVAALGITKTIDLNTRPDLSHRAAPAD